MRSPKRIVDLRFSELQFGDLQFAAGLAFVGFAAACLFLTSAARAQDMPLSGVLIDGEGWKVVSEGHTFTDGATCDAYGGFYFTDVAKGNTINKIDVDGKVSVYAKNAEKISGLQFGPDGRLYACQVGKYKRIVAFDKEGKLHVIAENVEPNDLVVTRKGWIYFTETRKKQVTSISPTGKVTATPTRINRPNGITLSPDQGTLAVSDHGGIYVWVYRIEADGSLGFEMPYMTMRSPGPGQIARGDGMATDHKNRYYVTSAEGLQMFDPTGRMGGVIAKPQNKPLVSVSFAGKDLSYLYVCCGDKVYRRKTKSKGVLFFMKK